ncbi:hypothetical protein RB213_013740 [Colletotrichum asianum]
MRYFHPHQAQTWAAGLPLNEHHPAVSYRQSSISARSNVVYLAKNVRRRPSKLLRRLLLTPLAGNCFNGRSTLYSRNPLSPRSPSQ